MSAYLGYDVGEEKRRLRLQAEVLEPLSDRALDQLGSLEDKRVLDVACGAMGILRTLSRRTGPSGSVVGTDVNDAMLGHARDFCEEARLGNVSIVKDDAYASALPPASFDLVHARFVVAPLGRDDALMTELERVLKPGGWILLEEPAGSSWQVWPGGAEHAALVEVIARAYDRHMGGFDAGKRLLPLARARGWLDVGLDAQVLAMPPGHPYLRAPLMMAKALRAVLLRDTAEADLDALVAAAEAAYARPETHGVTFALVQVWGRKA